MTTKKVAGKDLGSGKARGDKLGIKAGEKVLLLGPHDSDVRTDVTGAGGVVSAEVATADWILVALESLGDLAHVIGLRDRMNDESAIWAVWPKGKQELKEEHIRDAALPVGLVDVKVMSWSPSHSALKLVVRKELRASAKRRAK
jgi:hypothetical protein